MLTLIKLVLALAFGAAMGLGATYLALAHSPWFGAIRAGPWAAVPRAGSPDADPYERAFLARAGAVALGSAEGIAFTARTDDAGRDLDGRCTYSISGAMPVGRYWTLTANTVDGFLIDNPARHYGFTSRDVVRDQEGHFSIVVGQSAAPGNWLPLGDVVRFGLVLRVYDTPLSGYGATVERASLPTIARERCR